VPTRRDILLGLGAGLALPESLILRADEVIT
jgi:hypothetical protein